MSVESFTPPRAALGRWADEVLGLASVLTMLGDDFPETDALDAQQLVRRRVVRNAKKAATGLLLDMAGHGITPAEAKGGAARAEQIMVELHPNIPTRVLDGLDLLDPLPGGARRMSAQKVQELAAFLGAGDDGDEDEDYDLD